MIGLLRSTIDCIAGTGSSFSTNKYDCVASQRTIIILVIIKKKNQNNFKALKKEFC
jgi:hypothetical protein